MRPDGARIASDYAHLTGGGPLERPIAIDDLMDCFDRANRRYCFER